MDIPVHFEGTSPGVTKGGTLIKKRRYLKIKALPKDMPEFIEVRLESLDFGRSIKVEEIEENNFEILDPKIASVAVVEIPRALRGKSEEEEELEGEEMEEAEGAEATAEGEGAAAEGEES
jgi:large subunit ribosomal protein L25